MSLGRWLAVRAEDFAGWRADRRLGLATRRAARIAAARAFYLGDGLTMTRILDRYVLHLPTRDRSMTPSLLFNGRWEPWVTRTIAAHLRPGMIVGDIGANVGYFTMLMADRVGAAGHVHAFEPNVDLCTLLDRSLFANGYTPRATVHPFPLGADEGGEALLVFPGEALGGAAIWPVQPHDVPDSRPVALRRLDGVPGAERIELLKIDAEGFEPTIWAGMAGLLAGDALRTIVMEFSGVHYADPAGFLREIAAAGFGIERIDRRRGVTATDAAWLLAQPADEEQVLLLTR